MLSFLVNVFSFLQIERGGFSSKGRTSYWCYSQTKLLFEATISGCHSVEDATTGIPAQTKGGARRLKLFSLILLILWSLYFIGSVPNWCCRKKKSTWKLALALPFISCVSLGKFHKLSESQLEGAWPYPCCSTIVKWNEMMWVVSPARDEYSTVLPFPQYCFINELYCKSYSWILPWNRVKTDRLTHFLWRRSFKPIYQGYFLFWGSWVL